MKQDWVRIGLLAAICLIVVLLLNQWIEFKTSQNQNVKNLLSEQGGLAEPRADSNFDHLSTADSPPLSSDRNDLPTAPAAAVNKQATISKNSGDTVQTDSAGSIAAAHPLIEVQTELFDIKIDTIGGDLVFLALRQYPAELATPDQPFVLLQNISGRSYIARSGIVGTGYDSQAVYHSDRHSYRLEKGQQTLQVELSTRTPDGIKITKIYHFNRDDYRIRVQLVADNQSGQPWQGSLFTQLRRNHFPDPQSEGVTFSPSSFLGFAFFTHETPYKKFDFDEVEEEPFEQQLAGSWMAIVQHYFISAWIPDPEIVHNYRAALASDGKHYISSFVGPANHIAAGSTGRFEASFYAGPKIQKRLEKIAPGLKLTVDYGWLWWMSQPLFQILDFLYSLLNNWGLAIILLTVMVKLLFFPLSDLGYRSMARIRAAQPRITEIRERHGKDRQRMSKEMMDLYRTEKINPLGGCLPVLLQMPVFLALYWVLLESVELRQAPFFGWIHDLSTLDPWFVLPVLMGISMFVQQSLSPRPPDPTQAKIMMWMPAFMTLLFLFFPAGLVLYWLVNNILSIWQQWLVIRRFSRKAAKTGS